MNKKLLCAALLGGLGWPRPLPPRTSTTAGTSTGSARLQHPGQRPRHRRRSFVTLGLGKFISPNWSLDGELNYQNPRLRPRTRI